MSLQASDVWAHYAYNPLTGALYSRRRNRGPLGHLTAEGYLQTTGGTRVHRIIWVWLHGSEPTHTVDHINQDKADNRWWNLRDATRTTQNRNRAFTRLQATDIPAIRTRLAAGESQRSIAASYGCSREAIAKVKSGTNWAQ